MKPRIFVLIFVFVAPLWSSASLLCEDLFVIPQTVVQQINSLYPNLPETHQDQNGHFSRQELRDVAFDRFKFFQFEFHQQNEVAWEIIKWVRSSGSTQRVIQNDVYRIYLNVNPREIHVRWLLINPEDSEANQIESEFRIRSGKRGVEVSQFEDVFVAVGASHGLTKIYELIVAEIFADKEDLKFFDLTNLTYPEFLASLELQLVNDTLGELFKHVSVGRRLRDLEATLVERPSMNPDLGLIQSTGNSKNIILMQKDGVSLYVDIDTFNGSDHVLITARSANDRFLEGEQEVKLEYKNGKFQILSGLGSSRSIYSIYSILSQFL